MAPPSSMASRTFHSAESFLFEGPAGPHDDPRVDLDERADVGNDLAEEVEAPAPAWTW